MELVAHGCLLASQVLRSARVELQGHGVGADPCLQLSGASIDDDATVVDDRDAIAEPVGLFHVMGGEQHRRAVLADALELSPKRDAALWVESFRRLVEDQHLWSMDERAREVETPAHPP